MTKIFYIFTALANCIVFDILKLDPASRLAQSLHFFIEDTTKIFVLLAVLIYIIGFLRASLDVERVRDYLQKKHRIFGYFAAAVFGAITPFCSCSSIPLFLGFTAARIPVGITMAFLITSPMINEVAILLLWSILGWKFTVCYVGVGLAAGVLGGAFFDLIRAERFLTDLAGGALSVAGASCDCSGGCDTARRVKLSARQRHDFATGEAKAIISRIWLWVLLGIAAGAALHGFVPKQWVIEHLSGGQWWTVPAAVVLGIPLYSNATGIIPVVQTLLAKGLPVGTTLALMMSTVAASFPEFVLLKQVMKTRLLVFFFFLLLVLFTLVGWIFNTLGGLGIFG